MIYKDYFINSNFEDVWHTLQTYYNEPESVEKLYKTLFYTIRNLPIDDNHSDIPLKMVPDFDNMIHIAGAPNPIEWLTGREVFFAPEDMVVKYRFHNSPLSVPSESEIAAHLLYWSTLYDFKTQMQQHKDFEQYCDALENGTVRYSMEDPGEALSRKRKQCYYWKETVANDSAIDWRYILDMLRKRIEYHIGYHRYTERFVNSRHYISRMELCCRLLDLAGADGYDKEGVYINVRNASRFIGPIFERYDFESLGKDDSDNEYLLSKLRRAKAYKILWKFIDHNLAHWWD